MGATARAINTAAMNSPIPTPRPSFVLRNMAFRSAALRGERPYLDNHFERHARAEVDVLSRAELPQRGERAGTPEQVVKNRKSYTAKYLAPML